MKPMTADKGPVQNDSHVAQQRKRQHAEDRSPDDDLGPIRSADRSAKKGSRSHCAEKNKQVQFASCARIDGTC